MSVVVELHYSDEKQTKVNAMTHRKLQVASENGNENARGKCVAFVSQGEQVTQHSLLKQQTN